MTTKRFVKLQIIIILMFSITLIGNTFSWSSRPAVKGGAFMTTATTEDGKSDWTAIRLQTPENAYYINGNNCEAITYKGIMNEQGTVIYDEKVNTGRDEDFAPGDVLYFKTIITNSNIDITTNTSIFADISIRAIDENTTTTKLTTNMYLGVTEPITKTIGIKFEEISDEEISDTKYKTNFYPVLTGIEVGENNPNVTISGNSGTIAVEWYIYNGGSEATGDLMVEKIYFTNN